jgi:YVTN family beta-propeller protein
MKRIKNASIALLVLTFLLTFACKKKDNPPPSEIPDLNGSKGLFIINEGNYQWGNASITYYNFSDGTIYQNLFSQANGRPLGDIAQSAAVIGDKMYIVVNNSNKIEVVSLDGLKSHTTINGLISPRYMIPVGPAKAYVSDLYSNSISVVDLNSNTVVSSIPCKGSTEEMLLKGNRVYVTNTRSSYIYIIDITADIICDSIASAYSATSLAFDKNDGLWVLCAGNSLNGEKASLNLINTGSKITEKNFDLGNTLDIWDKMRINRSRDTLYYMNKGIFRMSIAADVIPSNPIITQGSSVFYGLCVHPENGNVFVSDARDYIQAGYVNEYSANGQLIRSIQAGINPGFLMVY